MVRIKKIFVFTFLILRKKEIAQRKLQVLRSVFDIYFLRKRNIVQRNLRLCGYLVYYENFEDLTYLFEEIFIREAYLLSTNDQPSVILDCGSNIGISIIWFNWKNPSATIVGFEPDLYLFEILRKNVYFNKLKNIEIHNIALYADSGNISLYFDPDHKKSMRGSIISDKSLLGKQIVICKPLSDFVNTHVDLLKIDVEGAEKIILSDLSQSDKLKDVENLIVEYHHHAEEDDDTLSKFLTILEEHRFGYVVTSKNCSGITPKMYQNLMIYAYNKHQSD